MAATTPSSDASSSNAIPPTSDANEFCDGVQSTLGGCDENQPTFAGEECDEIAGEFGEQLNERIVAILDGEEVIDGQGKSSRVSGAQFLLSVRVNQYLRRSDLVRECSAEPFLTVAEAEFSVQLKTELGPTMSAFQDHQYTYDEWRADLLQTLSIIDTDEDEPA